MEKHSLTDGVKPVLLCAGYATRLGALTRDRPKHLLPVAERAVLAYPLDRLAEAGFGRALLVTNARFADQFRRWRDDVALSLALDVLDDGTTGDETRLGSVGDLRFALETADVTGDVLVLNGDNLFTFSLLPLLERLRARGDTIALYDVGQRRLVRKAGHATLDDAGRVTAFVEKPDDPPDTLASIGIYAFRSGIRELVADYLAQGNSPDRTGDLITWLHRKRTLYACRLGPDDGQWWDIGTPDQLRAARRGLARRRPADAAGG